MTERLFFALWPGDAQRRALTRVQGGLPFPAGREAHPLDIHLTLVFLGPVGLRQRGCAEQAAAQVRGHAFELILDRVGSFPRSCTRWCGIDSCPQPLKDLVGALNNALGNCGFVPESRPFRPHITLARKAAVLESRLLEHPIQWPVEEFVLAYSQGGPPPRYRIAHRWSLRP